MYIIFLNILNISLELHFLKNQRVNKTIFVYLNMIKGFLYSNIKNYKIVLLQLNERIPTLLVHRWRN